VLEDLSLLAPLAEVVLPLPRNCSNIQVSQNSIQEGRMMGRDAMPDVVAEAVLQPVWEERVGECLQESSAIALDKVVSGAYSPVLCSLCDLMANHILKYMIGKKKNKNMRGKEGIP